MAAARLLLAILRRIRFHLVSADKNRSCAVCGFVCLAQDCSAEGQSRQTTKRLTIATTAVMGVVNTTVDSVHSTRCDYGKSYFCILIRFSASSNNMHREA